METTQMPAAATCVNNMLGVHTTDCQAMKRSEVRTHAATCNLENIKVSEEVSYKRPHPA